MDFETVLFSRSEGVALTALNRPHVLNAMNKQLWLDLKSALDVALADQHVRVVVLTGEGRAFSSGADLKESKTRSIEDYRDYLSALQKVSREILEYPKPILAAINGYALGSGYELALACDIRIAAQEAQIGSPEARVSSSVTGGALRLIQDLIGPGKARELLYTADPINGTEAERIGLVNKAVPLEALMDTTLDMARRIAANDAFSIKMIKKGLRLARTLDLEQLMEYEIEACLACVSTNSRQEALNRFEKRKDE